MQEILITIISITITVGLPILLAEVFALIRGKIQSESLEYFLIDMENAVSTAVSKTAQTYVDDLKKSGEFNTQSHYRAKEQAIETAIELLNNKTKKYLGKDARHKIAVLIEAEIKERKDATNNTHINDAS